MAFPETLAQIRRDKGLTQEQLAAKLYVTRQAVSRWEKGETTPGIDMLKLMAVVLDVPITTLLEMPGRFCNSCGMMLTDDDQLATDTHGHTTQDYCKWCVDQGVFTADMTMEAMIEDCAPRLAANTGMTLDEAVSLMGAVLPYLKRWQAVDANEREYGAEARALYGDEAVDAANERLLSMTTAEWQNKEQLEAAVIDALKACLDQGAAPDSPVGRALATMHGRWIEMQWGEGAYTLEAHKNRAAMYLADARFTQYYDSRAGVGATAYLVAAIQAL